MIATVKAEIRREKLNNRQYDPDRIQVLTQSETQDQPSGFLDVAVELLALINKHMEERK